MFQYPFKMEIALCFSKVTSIAAVYSSSTLKEFFIDIVHSSCFFPLKAVVI